MIQFDNKNIHIGIAPIAWTNDDMPELGAENSFEKCISEMHEAGYEGCEIGNKYPKDVQKLKTALEKQHLQVCNAWYSTFFTVNKKTETINGFIKHRDFLHELGAKVIGVCEQGFSIQGQIKTPLIANKPTFTNEQWKLLCEGMNELAGLAEEKGMRVCFHHHNGTGCQTNKEIDQLMENTNSNVYLLLDTGHIVLSERSQEALEEITKKYAHRIIHVHLKDVDMNVVKQVDEQNLSFLEGVKRNMFVVPGHGCINYEPFFKILKDANYKGWFLVEAEGDPSVNNPLSTAKFAREVIKKYIGI